MADLLETTDDSFEQEVLKASEPVVVDFWAPWCGPCRALAPTIESFAGATAGKVKVVKHNTQDHERTPSSYGITAIPTLLVFQGGEMKHKLVGAGQLTVDKLKDVVTQATGVQL